MLKYSNTFSSPLSNSFFFPVDDMLMRIVDRFAHHPSQRSASVSSDRRQGLHGPDHRKGVFFRRLYFLTKNWPHTISKLLLQTFADRALLIRSFIFLIVENLGNPWRSLKRSPLKTKEGNFNLEEYHFETCSASNSSRLATYLRGWLQKLPTYTRLT